MATHIIGIQIENRTSVTQEVQKILTEEGCYIKTRLGLHEVDASSCSPAGIVLLQLFGTVEDANRILNKLEGIDGVNAKLMSLGT